MSAVTKCDACGKVDKNENTYRVEVARNTKVNGEVTASTRVVADLCNECRKSLLGFLYKEDVEVPEWSRKNY